jgi:hypothetical protein
MTYGRETRDTKKAVRERVKVASLFVNVILISMSHGDFNNYKTKGWDLKRYSLISITLRYVFVLSQNT